MNVQSIAHYRVTGKLGEGGMGAVYRATDTRLNRDVAIKVIPDAFAQDPDRMARFAREAQVLAALNHPHIAAIYGLEENALILELVEGETLSGPLPLETALDYARQIAEALEYAHERGVIHRDLKPANVKVTPEGAVKVLDFGLAKIAEEPGAAANPEFSPTLTMRATQVGVILGTAAYMSPEQASGKPVDRRSDIWSFGVVLWEMLCGTRLFQGETVSHTLADVLRAEIDIGKLPPGTPPAIRRLIGRCLDRDRRQRLRDIGEARIAIEEYQRGPKGPSPEIAAAAVARRPLIAWAAAAAFALAAAVLGLLHFRQPATETRIMKYSLLPPAKTSFGWSSVSPDGRSLAFIGIGSDGKSQLWVRALDALEARPLANASVSGFPFWSPDSRSIAFVAGGKLKTIEAAGGPAQNVCNAFNALGGTWNRDGVILFADRTGSGVRILRAPASGGEAQPITTLDTSRGERGHEWPTFLPDGQHFLYTVYSAQPESAGVYVRALDSPAGSNQRTRVLADVSNAEYAAAPAGGTAPGYLLFARGEALLAQRFDTAGLRLEGEALTIVDKVGRNPVDTRAVFSASATGVLVYNTQPDFGDQLTWFDRTGKRLGTVGEPNLHLRPQLSPDQTQLAVEQMDGGTLTMDVWLFQLARGVGSSFTSGTGTRSWLPVWSPDGKRIVFLSNRDGTPALYQKQIGATGQPELLLESADLAGPEDWSPDGRFLLYSQGDPKTKSDLWLLPTGGKPAPFLQTEANEVHGVFSPDGKWVAYASDETGKFEIYVQAFPAGSGARSQISYGGGTFPKWRRDGKELFYFAGDKKIMAVEIKTGGSFQAGIPQALFEATMLNPTARFAVTANGQRFLIPTQVADGLAPATVVVNWTKLFAGK